jgi:hypothetical protein
MDVRDGRRRKHGDTSSSYDGGTMCNSLLDVALGGGGIPYSTHHRVLAPSSAQQWATPALPYLVQQWESPPP